MTNVLKIRSSTSEPWTIIPAVYTLVGSYDDLDDKPILEGVTIQGSKSFSDYNLNAMSNADIDELFR